MAESYLIIGDDGYIREHEITKLRDSHLSPSEVDLNFSTHTPLDLSDFMSSLTTMPFLSEKRVVLLRDAEDIPEETATEIINYFNNPLETSILVLQASVAFKKTKFYKSLPKNIKTIKADKINLAT